MLFEQPLGVPVLFPGTLVYLNSFTKFTSCEAAPTPIAKLCTAHRLHSVCFCAGGIKVSYVVFTAFAKCLRKFYATHNVLFLKNCMLFQLILFKLCFKFIDIYRSISRYFMTFPFTLHSVPISRFLQNRYRLVSQLSLRSSKDCATATLGQLQMCKHLYRCLKNFCTDFQKKFQDLLVRLCISILGFYKFFR